MHKIDHGWYVESKKALELFRERNLSNLNIEIIDERAERPTITLPISYLDPLLRQTILPVSLSFQRNKNFYV